jgi:hypothetical protein
VDRFIIREAVGVGDPRISASGACIYGFLLVGWEAPKATTQNGKGITSDDGRTPYTNEEANAGPFAVRGENLGP